MKFIFDNIFLIMAIGSLVIPSVYYWIYPYPQKLKKQKDELHKLHKERVEFFEKAIATAINHHSNDSRVFGGAEPWKQAERDELAWREKLDRENVEYENKKKELGEFPWTNAFVLLSIFLASIGLHLR